MAASLFGAAAMVSATGIGARQPVRLARHKTTDTGGRHGNCHGLSPCVGGARSTRSAGIPSRTRAGSGSASSGRSGARSAWSTCWWPARSAASLGSGSHGSRVARPIETPITPPMSAPSMRSHRVDSSRLTSGRLRLVGGGRAEHVGAEVVAGDRPVGDLFDHTPAIRGDLDRPGFPLGDQTLAGLGASFGQLLREVSLGEFRALSIIGEVHGLRY